MQGMEYCASPPSAVDNEKITDVVKRSFAADVITCIQQLAEEKSVSHLSVEVSTSEHDDSIGGKDFPVVISSDDSHESKGFAEKKELSGKKSIEIDPQAMKVFIEMAFEQSIT